MDLLESVQTVAALEARARWAEDQLAAGLLAADDAEPVIAISLRAADKVRAESGIGGSSRSAVDRSVTSLEALPASWERLWLSRCSCTSPVCPEVH